jgi:indolepyruvate ferredoxin oxidoreductase beta subunit
MESLRYLPWLSKQGWLVTNSVPFINIQEYPPLEEILNEIRKIKNNIIIDADSVAKEAGSSRAGNIVVLGAASHFIEMPFPSLENAIRTLFRRKGEEIVEVNLKALRAGRDFVKL